MKRVLVSVCLLLLLFCPAVAAADEPVKLSDINEMHRKRVQVQDILLAMNERGVGFRMTASAQRKLKSWDFTNVDIEHVRGIMAGKKYVPPKDEPDAEAGDAGNAVDDKKDFPIGHGHHRSYIDVMAKVLSRGFTAANLGYRTQTTDRATLHCSARMSGDVLPLLKNIEKTLIAKFPAALANATQPKTTLFVVADNDRDFRKIFEVLMQSYDKQWPGYADGYRMNNETFWVFGNAILINGDAWRDNNKRQRIMAFGYGYMIVSQISDHGCPQGLATGFGNVLEKRVAGTPWVTLNAESGEEDDAIANWARFVQEKLAGNRLNSINQICEYTISHMHNEHYATAWSFTEDLIKDPMKFYNFADQTATDDNTPRPQLIAKTYDIDVKGLHQRWAKTIKGE